MFESIPKVGYVIVPWRSRKVLGVQQPWGDAHGDRSAIESALNNQLVREAHDREGQEKIHSNFGGFWPILTCEMSGIWSVKEIWSNSHPLYMFTV